MARPARRRSDPVRLVAHPTPPAPVARTGWHPFPDAWEDRFWTFIALLAAGGVILLVLHVHCRLWELGHSDRLETLWNMQAIEREFRQQEGQMLKAAVTRLEARLDQVDAALHELEACRVWLEKAHHLPERRKYLTPMFKQ